LDRARITIGDISLEAELFQTPTSLKVIKALPIESEANRWGDEVYFDTGVEAEIEEDAKDVFDVGDICYWPKGNAIAIFFGPTPVSTRTECRAYEPVNLIGRIKGDVGALKQVKNGDAVRVELA
jgi:hypothetical protein